MKMNTLSFALAAAVLTAVGARAQGQTPSADQGQTAAPQSAPAAAPQTKDEKRAAWEANVKKACSAEIADGGVCVAAAGKDFKDLEKCLHENRKSLSDGCKAVVHKRRKKGDKAGAPAADAAPAPAPAATTPQ
jgi:hypothetical protein